MRTLSLINSFNRPSVFDFLNEDDFFSSSFNKVWKKDGDQYLAQIDLPGIKKSDLKIEAHEGLLSVEAKNEKRHYSFKTYIPKDLDQESIEASLEDGILTLSSKSKTKPVKLINIK